MAKYKCPKCGSTMHIGTMDRVQNLINAPFDMINGIMSGLTGGGRQTMQKTAYCDDCKCGMEWASDD